MYTAWILNFFTELYTIAKSAVKWCEYVGWLNNRTACNKLSRLSYLDITVVVWYFKIVSYVQNLCRIIGSSSANAANNDDDDDYMLDPWQCIDDICKYIYM